MKTAKLKTINNVASICLTVAGMIFLCLSLFGYEGEWSLPAALGCVSLSLLFQTVFRVSADADKGDRDEENENSN